MGIHRLVFQIHLLKFLPKKTTRGPFFFTPPPPPPLHNIVNYFKIAGTYQMLRIEQFYIPNGSRLYRDTRPILPFLITPLTTFKKYYSDSMYFYHFTFYSVQSTPENRVIDIFDNNLPKGIYCDSIAVFLNIILVFTSYKYKLQICIHDLTQQTQM